MQEPTPKSPKAKRQYEELTRRIIADLKPGQERGDKGCPGLRVRCTAAGVKVFDYRYIALDGALRQVKLGEFGPLTLNDARALAITKRVERDRGNDPKEEKERRREEARLKREAKQGESYTVKRLIQDYDAKVLSKQKRGVEGRRVLNEFEDAFGDRPAAGVTRRELFEKLIGPKKERAPRAATYLLSRIRCAYAHAIDEQKLPEDFVSPTVGIKGAAQVRRKRAFSDAELAMFLKWLPNSTYSLSVRHSLQLALLTGCRSGEVVAARWRDIDLQGKVWSIHETKNGEPHDVMLSDQAIELLNYRRGIDDTWVFPSPRKGEHIAQKALGLAQYVARQEEGKAKDPIEVGWTVHDLRRTVATGLARLGCPRVVQDRILNHVDSSVAAIYDTHHYDKEAREWLQKWSHHLDALKSRNVIPLARAA